MAKPTRSAAQLQQLLNERIDAIPDLKGQLTEAHRGRVIGMEAHEGGPNWTVWSAVESTEFRSDIARIIRSLQVQFDLED